MKLSTILIFVSLLASAFGVLPKNRTELLNIYIKEHGNEDLSLLGLLEKNYQKFGLAKIFINPLINEHFKRIEFYCQNIAFIQKSKLSVLKHNYILRVDVSFFRFY